MNEIIAFGSKYSLNNGIRVFVKSSKLYCDKLTIIVLNIEQNLRDFLEQENVNIIEGSELAQKYNINTNISPFTLKVIFYYLYIKHYTKSKNVFICDITDNYFKGNVFNLLSEDKSIFVASEDNKIKNCETIYREGRALPLRNLYLDVPTKPGIGVEVNMKMLEKVTVKKKEI